MSRPVVPAPLSPSGASVLAWWDRGRRDLPWRETRDPWAVLVCEVMAQQTQVSRVAERWGPFLERFPTPAALARETPGEAIRWWSGLGYNRRALLLHGAAVAVVEEHGGALPDDLSSLLALPGVGPYTARAVLAFAFERDHGIVDTNTARVLARWTGTRLGPKAVQHEADAALPPGRAWEWNQAMLDLGATVCVRRIPRCDDCPATARCGWWRAGRPDPDPAEGTAGVSTRQAAFAGSDRQGRGRLVAALRQAELASGELADAMGWPQDPVRAERVARSLVRDGLVTTSGDRYRLA